MRSLALQMKEGRREIGTQGDNRASARLSLFLTSIPELQHRILAKRLRVRAKISLHSAAGPQVRRQGVSDEHTRCGM
jgi:hypothetical protein